MKKQVLSLTFSFWVNLVIGQSGYHPFPEKNASWNFSYGNWSITGETYGDYSVMLTGDTIINGQIYHKFNISYVQENTIGICAGLSLVGYRGAIRQDTASRKVYIIPPSSDIEFLLYDFSLQIGDTVKGYLQSLNFGLDIVEAIDSIFVDNTYRTRWKINSCYEIFLVEGMGSTYGLFQPSPGCVADLPYFYMHCFRQNNQVVYTDSSTSCALITSSHSIENISNNLIIYPNPSTGTFTVSNNNGTIREIIISDIMGNFIRQQHADKQRKVTISGLDQGLYFLKITDNGGRTVNKKISCH